MAANVKTFKQWTLYEQKGIESLTYGEATFPKTEELGEYDVFVKLYAASLNYRDLAITRVSSTSHTKTSLRFLRFFKNLHFHPHQIRPPQLTEKPGHKHP